MSDCQSSRFPPRESNYNSSYSEFYACISKRHLLKHLHRMHYLFDIASKQQTIVKFLKEDLYFFMNLGRKNLQRNTMINYSRNTAQQISVDTKKIRYAFQYFYKKVFIKVKCYFYYTILPLTILLKMRFQSKVPCIYKVSCGPFNSAAVELTKGPLVKGASL